MEVDDILLELVDRFTPPFPRETLEAAIAKREEITPALIRLVETAQEDFFAEPRCDNGFLFALFLLAHFRETAAHRPILRLFREGGEKMADATGDFVTEDLRRVLADTFDGDFSGIQSLADDQTVYIYTRSAAWQALGILCSRGALEDESFKERLAGGMDRAAEGEDAEISNFLVSLAMDFEYADLLPRVEVLYNEGLAGSWYNGTLENVRREFHKPRARGDGTSGRDNYQRPCLDAIADMERWYCWREDSHKDWSEDEADLDERDFHRSLDRADTFKREEPKVGRNDPCLCGSGAKFKKCCGR